MTPLGLLLVLGGCNAPPEPRPGTQIGVEESGGCTDDEVVPIGLDDLPEGALVALGDVLPAAEGRFVGTTRDEAPLTLELAPDVGSAVWATQVRRSDGQPDDVSCPPRWRLDVATTLRSDEVDWAGVGTLSLDDSGDGYLLADGPPDVGQPAPPDVDAASSRLTGFGFAGAWTLSLVWRGQAAADGDAVEAPALIGDVAPE